jgi:manganese/zinc/iron transport system permease protein
VLVFFKELKLSSFDPALATSMGFSSTFMHYALMVLVAITAVASFESVGNILVVAMFIVPPATAFLLTDRLGVMLVLSALVAALAAVGGHVSAVIVPTWFGYQSTSTAGMMAVVVGLLFALALMFAPRQGLVLRWVRNRGLSLRILSDDVVAYLFRRGERLSSAGQTPAISLKELSQELFAGSIQLRLALAVLRARQELLPSNGGYRLTQRGEQHAQDLVRSHRLWEQYLVSEASVDATRIHDKAERLEHFTDKRLREQLDQAMDAPDRDPHGSAIPPERLQP